MHHSIGFRLLVAVLLLVLGPVAALHVMLNQNFHASQTRTMIRNLTQISDKKARQIDVFVRERLQDVFMLGHNPLMKAAIQELAQAYAHPDSLAYRQADGRVRPFIEQFLAKKHYYDAFLITPAGDVVYTVKHEEDFSTNLRTGIWKNTELAKVVWAAQTYLEPDFSEYALYAPSKAPAAFVAAPIMDGRTILGVVALQINTNHFMEVMLDNTGLGETGETIIARREGDRVLFLLPLKSDPQAAFQRTLPISAPYNTPTLKAVHGWHGASFSSDYRGREVLAVWSYLPSLQAGMVVKMDAEEVMTEYRLMSRWQWVFLIGVAGSLLLISLYVMRFFVRPIIRLTKASDALAAGDWSQRATVSGRDEIGRLALAFNTMTDKLHEYYESLETKVRKRTISLESANQRLQETLSVQRAILDSAATTIISTDLEGVVRSFNNTAEEKLGYRTEEVVGCMSLAIFHDPDEVVRRAERLSQELGRPVAPGFEVLVVKALHGKPDENEWTYIRKNGDRFPVSLSVTPIYDTHGQLSGFMGVGVDITARKMIEEDLRLKHRAVEESPVGVIITDKAGVIKYINPSSLSIYGYDDAKELEGCTPSIFKSGTTSQKTYQTLWQHLMEEKSWNGDIQNKRKDGSLVWVRQHICPIRNLDGQIYHYISIHEDVTELKEYRENLEATVEQRTAELRLAKEAAEAGSRAKAAFVANMSHEIRTPMNAIIGFAEVVLQAPELTSDTYQHVRTILGSSKALLGIINDILDVTKLESGKFTIETICFHLKNALVDTLRTVEHRALEKNLPILVEYDETVPLRVMGDPNRLRQVLLNLVGNAIKFTGHGRIVLSVRPGDQPDRVHFSVADSGIGMTPEQLESVFEAFSQADVSTTRRFGGTGLGTTISKQIVERMQGTLWAESEYGKGSVFHFTALLPAATGEEECLYEHDVIMEKDYVSPRLFRILLAEDVEANATLAMLRLKEQGHVVEWARNGHEAVKMYTQGSFEMILMDIMMPELDGLGATQAIRRLEQNTDRHITILALTASVMREDSEKYMAEGMDGIEAKPVDFNRLFVTMEQLVPRGIGRPNIHRQSGPEGQAWVDFSPLDGLVDHVRALKTWRDASAYAKALLSFVETRSGDAEQMHRLLLDHPDDGEPARAVAHALKGVSGNLAMDRIARLATEIDDRLKSGQREGVEARLEELRHGLQELKHAMARLQVATEGPTASLLPFDGAEMGRLLRELNEALESLNPDPVEPILVQMAHYVMQSDLAPIKKCVDLFDFDAAQSRMVALADKLGVHLE